MKDYQFRHQKIASGVLTASDLSDDELALCKSARRFSENAYAPYSGFHVGSAVRTEEGEIFGGANLENASFGLCICAEVSAISNANTSSRQRISEIAVYGKSVAEGKCSDAPVFPCGRCRQVIAEASARYGNDITVLSCNSEMTGFSKNTISELLPHAFGPENLPQPSKSDIEDIGEETADMVDLIQSSLDERAAAFLTKEPPKGARALLLEEDNEQLEGIVKNISKRFRKRPL